MTRAVGVLAVPRLPRSRGSAAVVGGCGALGFARPCTLPWFPMAAAVAKAFGESPLQWVGGGGEAG